MNQRRHVVRALPLVLFCCLSAVASRLPFFPSAPQQHTRQVLGARIRMQSVYSDYLLRSAEAGRAASGFHQYPCANVLHSHAMKGLKSGDDGCATLPTKQVEDHFADNACFAELWLSVDKIARGSGLVSPTEALFEVSHSLNGLLGSLLVDFESARNENQKWIAINVTETMASFLKGESASERGEVKFCPVQESSAPSLASSAQRLSPPPDGTVVRQKPFIITGQHGRARGLDDFVHDQSNPGRRRRRSADRITELNREQQGSSPSPSPVTTFTEAPTATTEHPSSSCALVPLDNISLRDILQMPTSNKSRIRILFPVIITLNDCSGSCSRETRPVSAHALLMREVRRQGLQSETSTGCCVPLSFSQEPFALLIEGERGETSLQADLLNPKVTKCGCS